MEHIIEIDNISFAYEKDSESSGVNVLKDVTLNIEKGSFLAVIGKNGSGKSTMAKHINALCPAPLWPCSAIFPPSSSPCPQDCRAAPGSRR